MVRPTSIWGPWFGIPYKTFFTTIAKGYYFHPGKAQVRKSFGFVGNTVFQLQRLSLAQDACVHGRTFYLADYDPIDVREMADLIQRMMGVRRIRTVPISVLRAAAMGGDFAKKLGWRNPPISSFRLDNLLTNMIHDLEPLCEVAGPLPYSWREGVGKTVEWMRSQGEL
jgi:nucleoside-diphosphate-sugar epimerase